MKARRHHNTDGRRQIQRGRTRTQVERIARLLGVPLLPLVGEAGCASAIPTDSERKPKDSASILTETPHEKR